MASTKEKPLQVSQVLLSGRKGHAWEGARSKWGKGYYNIWGIEHV